MVHACRILSTRPRALAPRRMTVRLDRHGRDSPPEWRETRVISAIRPCFPPLDDRLGSSDPDPRILGSRSCRRLRPVGGALEESPWDAKTPPRGSGVLAEGRGFEPLMQGYCMLVFKTSSFGRSDNPPPSSLAKRALRDPAPTRPAPPRTRRPDPCPSRPAPPRNRFAQPFRATVSRASCCHLNRREVTTTGARTRRPGAARRGGWVRCSGALLPSRGRGRRESRSRRAHDADPVERSGRIIPARGRRARC